MSTASEYYVQVPRASSEFPSAAPDNIYIILLVNKVLLKEKAIELAKYSSIVVDLRLIKTWLKKILELQNEDEENATEINGLWIASLIAYARCFTSGKRKGVDSEDVYSNLNGDPLGLHKYLIDMRSKHIAHSVNPFEQVKVGILADDQGEVIGTAVLQTRLVSFTDKDIKQFGALVTHAEEFCAEKAQELQDEIGKELQGKKIKDLDLDKLEKMGITIPGPVDVDAPRA